MKYLVLILCILFISCNKYVSNNEEISDNEPIKIKSGKESHDLNQKDTIHFVISSIDSLIKIRDSDTILYQVDSLQRLDLSAGGSDVIMFYTKGILRKVKAVHYGETGYAQINYYLNNKGDVIFIRRNDYHYQEPLSINSNPVISKSEVNKYYFENDTLLQWVQNDSLIIESKSMEFKKEKELINDLDNIINLKN